MAKIISLSLPRLENGTLARFLEQVTGFAKQDEKLNQHCRDQVEALVVAYNLLMLVLEKHNVDLLTSSIEDADKWRDSCYSILRNLIKMMQNALEPEKRLAAENLWKIVKEYGYLADMKYAKQTGLMNSFIQDMLTNHLDDIETLGAKQILLDLQAANDEYKRLVDERTQNQAAWVKGEMVEARKKCYNKYRDLVEAITGLSIVMGDADFQPFVDILNAIIRTYRIGLGQSADDSDSTDDSDDELTIPTKTATFHFANGDVIKRQVEVGTVLITPDNTEGYIWDKEIPELMPNKNLTFREVPIETREATATFHFFDHREEEIRQLVGSVLNAPANTDGYYWDPTVPATMPADNTAYYELPIEDNDNGGDNNGNYPPGYDPDADEDPGV